MPASPTLLLVHGAWRGSWCWGNVAHVIYLAAFALARGEALLGTIGTPPPWLDVRPDGYVHARTPEAIFFNDVASEVAREAVAKLRPHSLAAFTDELTEASWETLPSTYIVCKQDRAIPPEVQRRMAVRTGGAVRELDTSHSPFLSRPDLLADLVRETAAGIGVQA